MQQTEFILNKDIRRIMWKLSLPAMLAMVMFGLNAFLDSIFVGQLVGETALAGVAIAYPLSSLMMGFGSWIGTGAGNVLSIAIGANDEKMQGKLLGVSTFLSMAFGIIFTIVAWFAAEKMILVMGGSGEVLEQGTRYFKISILGTIFWVYALTLNMIIRGEGKMKEAAIMMGLGLLVNIILNPIFISVLDMGVEGAAWATTIGMIVYSIAGYLYFRKGKASFNANIHAIQYDRNVTGIILKSGLPSFIITIMSLVQAIVVFNAINSMGTDDDLAFFAAGNRILFFMMTPLFGLMRALQPVIGINYGAGQFDRVKSSFKVFTFYGFLIVVPFWLAMNLFPEPTLRLMLPTLVFNEQSMLYFHVYIMVLPILPLVFNSLTFFPAIGSPKIASLVAMCRQLFFYVPVMLTLPYYFGLDGVYFGGSIIDILVTIWLVWLVWKTFRKLMPQTNENEAITTQQSELTT